MSQNSDSAALFAGRRRAYVGAVAFAVVAFLGSGLAPAYAATPLQLISAECDPLALSGHDYVECFAEATGGTAPYTYQWSGSTVGSATGNPVRFACTPGHVVGVALTLTDAVGDVVHGGSTVTCGSIAQ
jgi:hypothetical protein